MKKGVSSQKMNKASAITFIVIFLTACVFDSREKWRDGYYSVLWIDTFENLTLNYDVGNGDSIGRIGKTILAVGSNNKYVVVKQRLDLKSNITNYYIIDRLRDHKYANPQEFVMGPLSEKEYELKKVIFQLPDFNKRF